MELGAKVAVLLSINYWTHRFRLCQQPDARSNVSDRTFDVVLDWIGHLFCVVVKKRLCSGELSGKSGPDPDLPGGQISPMG